LNHTAARRFLSRVSTGKHGVPVTTDYVLDETLTLLRSRRGLSAAREFISKIRESSSVSIFWVDKNLFEKALEIFRKSEGKSWSFTDCTSFALMNELSIGDAFAFDGHFREAGKAMLP
jgi:uncharacterized protein